MGCNAGAVSYELNWRLSAGVPGLGSEELTKATDDKGYAEPGLGFEHTP